MTFTPATRRPRRRSRFPVAHGHRRRLPLIPWRLVLLVAIVIGVGWSWSHQWWGWNILEPAVYEQCSHQLCAPANALPHQPPAPVYEQTSLVCQDFGLSGTRQQCISLQNRVYVVSVDGNPVKVTLRLNNLPADNACSADHAQFLLNGNHIDANPDDCDADGLTFQVMVDAHTTSRFTLKLVCFGITEDGAKAYGCPGPHHGVLYTWHIRIHVAHLGHGGQVVTTGYRPGVGTPLT